MCVCQSESERERERGVAQTGVSQTGKAAPYFPLKGKHDGVGLTTIQDSKLKGFNFFTRTGLRTVFSYTLWTLEGIWFSKKPISKDDPAVRGMSVPRCFEPACQLGSYYLDL